MANCDLDFDIMNETFPDNVSLSDLCDCGTYKRRKPNVVIQQHKMPFPVSDYAQTYQAVANPRPRSSKRPPPSPRVRDQHSAPMLFTTNQREDFHPHRNVERTKPIVPEGNYERLPVPVETVTSYSHDFIPKQIQPEYRRMEPRSNYILPNAKFDGKTTNKEHFKQWLAKPSMTFGELPSFTGSILYPEKEMLPASETKDAFQGTFAKRPDAVRLADANITLGGDMFLTTTNNDTFTKIDGDHRAQRIVKQPTLQVNRKFGKFQSETQNRRDFPGYSSGQPIPRRPAEPAPETIDLKFDNKLAFDTEQRSTFKGHDILQHPVAKPIRYDPDTYEPPSTKFETETSNKRDFKPINVSENYSHKAKAPHSNYVVPDAKFDDRTMSKSFFKDPGTVQRVRYGDFHENKPYLPPQSKFEGVSTTKTTFTPKKWNRTEPFRPQDNAVDTSGHMDFNTVHRDTYQKPKVKLCRAKVYLIQQELRRQREAMAKSNNQVLAK